MEKSNGEIMSHEMIKKMNLSKFSGKITETLSVSN